MIRKEITNFDIVQICRSGQCFRMEQTGPDTCCVTAGNRYLEVTQQGDICLFSCGEEEFEHFWRQYFDLDEDYGKFKDKISSRDHYLQAAAEFGRGIRILRQDLCEMIASFLISQQNNIVRIRRCIRNLCEAYGQRLEGEQGNVFYGFPSPESLGGLPEDALKGCNLGYRSKYVVRTARDIAEGKISLDVLSPGKRRTDEAVWGRRKSGGLHLPVRPASDGCFSGGYAYQAGYGKALSQRFSQNQLPGISGCNAAIYFLL